MTLEETSIPGNLCVHSWTSILRGWGGSTPPPACRHSPGRQLPPGLARPKIARTPRPVPTLGASHELHDAVC